MHSSGKLDRINKIYRIHEILRLETPSLAAGRKAGFARSAHSGRLVTMPYPLGKKESSLGVQGGGSAPVRGWGESPTLGTELGAEGAGAKLRRTSDGRVYYLL